MATFAIITLTLFLPVILSHINNVALKSKPDYFITNSGLGNLMIFSSYSRNREYLIVF